ncbi:MAG: peptidylprolyl isomerase, partial [Oscillospiraceae bacterium]|nr:peptidylprolyl isomerase [Oscillospiraceae bacterium]
GRGVTEKTVRNDLSRWLIADEYSSSIEDSFDYTDEEVDAYYKEHKNDIDKVTFNNYFIDGSAVEANQDLSIEGVDAETAMANAKATAEEFIGMLDDGETFIDTAFLLAKDEEKSYYQDENACETSAVYSDIQKTLADWLYDSSRKPGDYEMFIRDEEGSAPGYFVLQYLSKEDSNYHMVDVRHILIKPETVNEEDYATDEEYQAALTAADEAAAAKAQEIYDEWLAGDATEDSFAKLAEENSEDSNASSGGIYEDVKKGQMVATFNDWCFDSSRKTGDSGIVKTEYGYHIMYFVGNGELYSRQAARDMYESESYNSWLEETEAGYPVNTTGLFSIAKTFDVVK